jgi:hypothetical protein
MTETIDSKHKQGDIVYFATDSTRMVVLLVKNPQGDV